VPAFVCYSIFINVLCVSLLLNLFVNLTNLSVLSLCTPTLPRKGVHLKKTIHGLSIYLSMLSTTQILAPHEVQNKCKHLKKNSSWFINLFINAFHYSDIRVLGSVLQNLTPKVILSHKYHILTGTELHVCDENQFDAP
jgi:hypothetical protein